MYKKVNLVFGSSGLIGKSFKKVLKKDKNYIFFSKNTKNFLKYDLNKSLKNFPYKKVEKCFFFASPRILNKNLKKKIFSQEYIWLKNVIKNIDIKQIIYLSSSSVYYKKNHVIGSTKKRCEDLIIKNKKKFDNYQIWRPFNLVGSCYYPSDHFLNILFKKMFVEKKNSYSFKGNDNDMRGYSSVDEFVTIMLKYSNTKKSFLKDFGNIKLTKLNEIIKLFNIYYFKLNKKHFKFNFLSKKKNINKIKLNSKNIYSKGDTIKILKIYLKNSINDKKM